jgi:hypothetical protein
MANPSDRQRAASPQEDEMADAILRYLAEHPHASDTLEGIAEWWVMRQTVRVQVHRVARVLRRLTEAGFLEQFGEGEYSRYRLRAGGPPAGGT